VKASLLEINNSLSRPGWEVVNQGRHIKAEPTKAGPARGWAGPRLSSKWTQQVEILGGHRDKGTREWYAISVLNGELATVKTSRECCSIDNAGMKLKYI
jgi:hypothetical protein